VLVRAYKIVNGQNLPMGDLDFAYDAGLKAVGGGLQQRARPHPFRASMSTGPRSTAACST
jgi:hypothetical protein